MVHILNHLHYEIDWRDGELNFSITWMDDSFRSKKNQASNKYSCVNGWKIKSVSTPAIYLTDKEILLWGDKKNKDCRAVIIRSGNIVNQINEALRDWDQNFQFEDIKIEMQGVSYKRVSCEYVGVNDSRKRFIVELEENV
jgi:hypothetical protein